MNDRRHILLGPGFGVHRASGSLHGAGGPLHGAGEVMEQLLTPGTSRLRTSVLAMWTDQLAGLLVAEVTQPRVPVTIQLDVQLYEPAPQSGRVRAVGRLVKCGQTILVATVDFCAGSGRPFAVGAASFMISPDRTLHLPENIGIDVPVNPPLSVPLAERAGLERRSPGVVRLAVSPDGMNSAQKASGGLMALAAEEAALSAVPPGTLCSLDLRFLQPVRLGPIVGFAEVRSGLGLVELHDAGNNDRLAALATTRHFPASSR